MVYACHSNFEPTVFSKVVLVKFHLPFVIFRSFLSIPKRTEPSNHKKLGFPSNSLCVIEFLLIALSVDEVAVFNFVDVHLFFSRLSRMFILLCSCSLRLLTLPWGSFLYLSVQKDPKDRPSAQDLLVRPMKPFVPVSSSLYKFAGFCGYFQSDLVFVFWSHFRDILSSACTMTCILTFPLTSLKQDLPLQHFKTSWYIHICISVHILDSLLKLKFENSLLFFISVIWSRG